MTSRAKPKASPKSTIAKSGLMSIAQNMTEA